MQPSTPLSPAPVNTPASTRRSGVSVADELRATLARLRSVSPAAFGILTGHVWIWNAAHIASASFPGQNSGVWLYGALSLVALVIAGLALVWGPRLTESLCRRLDWPLAVFMAAATVLMCVPLPLPIGVQVGFGGALCGVGMAWMYLQWAFFYGKLDTQTIILCVFGAMLFGSIVKFPLDLLGTVAGTVACVALCLASPALLRIATAHAPVCTEPSTDNPATSYASLRDLRPLLRTLCGIAAYGVVIGIMQSMRVEAAYTPQWLLSLVHHGLEVAAAAAVLWYALGSTRHGLHFSGMWRAVLLFTGAGVMALPIVGPMLSGWALVAVAVGQTLLVMLLWAMLADVAHHSTLNPLVIFGGGWTAYCLSFPIGQLVGGLLNDLGSGEEYVGLIVYLLALATVFLLGERDFSQKRVFGDLDEPPIPPSMGDAVRTACDAVGKQSELTERETEVMYLICMGRSKGYIAETLSISENTVRSHSRHLYSKLGVHSKQELLDLVLAHAEERG